METTKLDLSNLEAEQAVLGAIMSNNAAMNHAEKAAIKPEHFSEPLHQRIFRLCVDGIASGNVVNPVTIKHHFADDKQTQSYMAKLIGASTSIVNVHDYSLIIVELAARRLVIEAAKEVLETAYTSNASELAIVLGRAMNGVNLANDAPQMRNAKQITAQIIEDLQKDEQATPTGIGSLDGCMEGGLFAGKAYGFAARKKVGKTILASTISHNLNVAGEKHLFICGEMSGKEVHQRALGRVLNVYPNAFRNGFAKAPHMIEKLGAAYREMPENAIYYDAPGITFNQLRQAVGSAYINHGIKGFILDYWQLVGGKESRDSEAYHLGVVAQWMAEVVRRLGIWCICMAQSNQDGNTRGGEGLRLAFDQVYQIHAIGDDPSSEYRWVEMMDTRYTKWRNIGSPDLGGWKLSEKGLYFQDCQDNAYDG